MLSLATVLASIVVLTTLPVSVFSSSLVIPTSPTEQAGLLCGIKTYSTPGAWSPLNYATVEATLVTPVGSLAFGLDSLLRTPAVATPAITNPVCNVTTYSQVAPAVAACTNIAITNLTVPGNTTLDLTKLKANTVVTFYEETFWTFANYSYDLLKVGGTNVTLQGAPCSVLNGNGPSWWDGNGSNGGVPKPDHMITGSKLLGNSVIKDLYIKNAPTHVFSMSNNFGLLMRSIVIDMMDGYAILPNGLEAAHNTDGFDVSSSTSTLMTNNVVYNQDDCVAITSGGGIVSNNFYCSGGHGLSIGSVGGKSNNTVNGVTFSNSVVTNSQNGPRIKTNSGTTGTINAVTYQNIAVNNISIYGLDIQQDYLNGGPTGIPTNGVNITNITMTNVVGTVQSTATDYYILVGNDTSTATWTFTNVLIVGGNKSCNAVPKGFSC